MTDQPQRKPLSNKTKAGIFAAIVIFGGIGLATGNDDPESTGNGDTSQFGQGDAWLNCQDAVEEQLANPATADFSMLSSDITESGDTFNVAGTLTAENAFGVEAEIEFTCEVTEGEPVDAEVTVQ